jgi:hypothetical protein
MKAGDIVELDFRVTRKGSPIEDQVGLIVEIKSEPPPGVIYGAVTAIVNFCGVIIELPVSHLKVLNEK